MRDLNDNVVIICSIENFDPMGIHTGDSITVAPAQTLSDKEYQVMRNASIDIIREIGVDTGGSNIQFAMNPETGDMIVTVGGDGRFCEVITGFLSRSDSANDRFPLALIPAGTGNSQANDMGIFSHMDAVQLILKNRLRRMDISKVTFNGKL